ncbi:UDP-N-acetylglucosamine--N-acetylmuramyl-(pentapeptide) pyrophosphoryl-undecaprenol N-acetylglucosamine transferase [Patescibacteria group bacterium]|nr:UDP-N-acetylglucosamine--N-acetylmuramyl-(pentapeptide) pyrophosphoryl-undecaprenol N-acetylglucosamine transferase [Patescibacteria group bacterium]
MSKTGTILFVGGGSGGHIAPLLAVLEAVQRKEPAVSCCYAGLKSDLESPLITGSTLRFEKYSLPAGKLNRFMTWRHLTEAGKMVSGMVAANRLIRRLKPDVLLAKGGFVGVNAAIAARRAGIPIYCHESDVIPGLANRFVAGLARRVFTTYPERYYHNLPQSKLRAVGQPVRSAFFNPAALPVALLGREVSTAWPVLTVIGGSQGAARINRLAEGMWRDALEETQIIHITGKREFTRLREAAQKLPGQLADRLFLVEFPVDELPAIFQASTVIISRAGSTIAEVAAACKPLILLPLSTAAQDHQTANARVLADTGAAVVLDETNTDSFQLWNETRQILTSPEAREKLSAAIVAFANPEAADRMADELLEELK